MLHTPPPPSTTLNTLKYHEIGPVPSGCAQLYVFPRQRRVGAEAETPVEADIFLSRGFLIRQASGGNNGQLLERVPPQSE